MNILVIIPSREWLDAAGVRIRYKRLIDPLSKLGINLRLAAIDDMEAELESNIDILLISKVMDCRSYLLAKYYSSKGVRIGLDLFDDYFSQKDRTAFRHLQYWLSRMQTVIAFALCSTPAMHEISKVYLSSVPTYLLQDPAERLPSHTEFSNDLTQKISNAISNKEIKVVWFGIGDNPHFDVGLQDLVANSDLIARLSRSGYSVHLTILTNERSLTERNIHMLSRLSTSYKVLLWSVDVELEVLQQSLIAFLPVGFQRFSRAKSTNRCTTALTRGCQVLTTGYSLYQDYANFIYYNPDTLLDDIENNCLRLNPETIDRLTNVLTMIASPETEATGLADFLNRTEHAKATTNYHVAIIHGISHTTESHDYTHRFGGLSVASPLSRHKLDYDITFVEHKSELQLRVSKNFKSKAQSLIADSAQNPYNMTNSNSLETIDITQLCKIAGILPNETIAIIKYALKVKTLQEKMLVVHRVMFIMEQLVRACIGEANIYYNERQAGVLIA
jgi:hypothetical protein